MPSVILPVGGSSSYSIVARYSQHSNGPTKSIDEFRSRQRNDIISQRRSLAQDNIINRRKSLNCSEIFEDEENFHKFAELRRYFSQHVVEELGKRLEYVRDTCQQLPSSANDIISINWRTIMDGLGSCVDEFVVGTMQLLASIDLDVTCLKSLIRFGLLYKLERLFRETENHQWQLLSVILLNHFVKKVPESIPVIVDMMATHKMLETFNEILILGTHEMQIHLVEFFNICIESLCAMQAQQLNDKSYTPPSMSPQRFTTNDVSFDQTILRLLPESTIGTLLDVCFCKTNRTRKQIVTLGVSIFSAIFSTISFPSEYIDDDLQNTLFLERYKWQFDIIKQFSKVIGKFIASVERLIKRSANSRKEIPIEIPLSLLEICTQVRDSIDEKFLKFDSALST